MLVISAHAPDVADVASSFGSSKEDTIIFNPQLVTSLA